MNSEELFRRLLGLEEPWIIKEIKFDHQEKRVGYLHRFPKGIKIPMPGVWTALFCPRHRGTHMETPERIPVSHISACKGTQNKM